MRPNVLLLTSLLALMPVTVRAADTRDTAPATSSLEAVVFLDADQDEAAVQVRLQDLLQRTLAKLQGDAALASPPRSETTRKTLSARGDVKAVEVKVTLPEGITREAFLRALAADDTCVASSASCGESCRRLAAVASGGHWHFLPDTGHSCLIAFLPDEAAALQAEKVVLRRPKRYGVGTSETPRTTVTVGRPDWPEEIDKQP